MARTSLQQQEIEAHRMLTDSLNLLSSRMERTETDFVGHLKKVEDKLEQLVDLTKTVAVLQQQTSQQTDQISEVRSSLREYSQKFDNSISRIHTRLDEIQNHQRDKMELHSKEVDIKLETVKTQANSTEKELKQWLNRGVGAWLVFALIVGALQTGMWRWVDAIEKDKATVVQQSTQTTAILERHTQQIDNVVSISKDNQASIRRLEQMSMDTDRQIEGLKKK